MPGVRRAAVLTVTLAAVAGLSACGNGGDVTIPGDEAQQLRAPLDAAERAVSEGDCATVQTAVRDFAEQVNLIPQGAVDQDVKDALLEAAQNLRQLAEDPSQCTPAGATGIGGPAAPSTTTSTAPASVEPPASAEQTEPPADTEAKPPKETKPPKPAKEPKPPKSEGGGDSSPSGGVAP